MIIKDFSFSRHALERALDMDVPGSELRACLEKPWMVRSSGRDDGRNLYFGDRITCVVSETGEVVTVVWRTADGWAADITAGSYEGRRFNQEEWV